MKLASFTLALLATTSVVSPAVAQAQAPSAAAATADRPAVNQIEEVVVQARRTAESQQDVPIAVSTVTDERLETAAVASVADIQRLVPALRVSLGATGQLDFSIRAAFLGFGVDPSVVTYVDEAPTHPKAMVYNVYDLGGVEVLKGPQGTLFGRNSTGGAVLFASKRPSFEGPGGFLRARYGNLDDRQFEGAFNAVLSDTFALRIAGRLQRRDGIPESVTRPGLEYDNRRNQALRLSAVWTPTDDIENHTILSHYWVREHRAPLRALSLAGPCTGPTTPVVSCLYQPPFNSFVGTGNLRVFVDQEIPMRGSNRTVNNDPSTDDVALNAITNRFTVDLGPLSLKNITQLGDMTIGFSKDWDGTPTRVVDAYLHDQTDIFYTETQLFGQLFEDRLDWRVGATFSRDKTRTDGNQTVFPFPVSLTTPQRSFSRTNFESTALFAQANLDLSMLLTGLSVTGGYRYTWDDRTVSTQAFSGAPTQVCALQQLPVPAAGPQPFPSTDIATCTRRLALDFKEDTYNLTVDWKPTERILLYVAHRKGYKSGSFNIYVTDPAISQYAPEVVKDVELGLKADWNLGEMPVRTNIAVFRAKYDNIQTSHTVVDPVSGAVAAVTLNVDPVSGAPNKATIKGFEVEVIAKPTSWLELSGFYSKVNAKYDQFFSVAPRLDLAGQKIAGVTPSSYGVSAQLDLPLRGPFAAAQLTGSYFRRAAPNSNDNSSTVTPPGRPYDSVDARFALIDILDTGADLAVYGRNLGDKESCVSNTIITGLVTTQCSEGRTYGLELIYRFGAER